MSTSPPAATRNGRTGSAPGCVAAGRGAVLSGWDAVRAFELGSRRPPTDEVLILASGGTHRLVGRVLVRPSRRPLAWSRLVVPGVGSVPVARCARAVADTSIAYRSLPPVRALVTSAVQQGRCTFEDLLVELDAGPRKHSAHLRRALGDVAGGAASIAEAELADLMRVAGLPPFELNVVILDPSGRHIATADVLWRARRAVLEVDSKEHHFLEPQWRGTMRRHNLLTRYGLAVAHYPPLELRRGGQRCMAEVAAWLRARAGELGVSYPSAGRQGYGEPLQL